MALWKRDMTLADLNQTSANTMIGHLGIEYTLLAEDSLEGTMPVDTRTKQPFGLLHGGASVVLAESLGSIAGYLCSHGEQQIVGVEINANHLRSVSQGKVRGVCRPLHVGRRSQVWQIEIFDEQQHLCCVSRLTTMVVGG
jgi:1,4-dihydroxy-2-naphthoyl-CoA hydrolase